jgi:DNA-binding transcriptional regulator GbsR (MarR family)
MEDEIVNYLMQSQLLIGEKRSTAQIISFFITRENLTQAKLRELTLLSPGTVSQEINYLLERNIIKERGRLPTGEYIYSMDSVTDGFIKSYLHSIKYYLKYKDDFKDIKENMEKCKNQLKDQERFDSINQLVNLFIKMFPVVEKVINILKRELKDE